MPGMSEQNGQGEAVSGPLVGKCYEVIAGTEGLIKDS